LTGDAPGPAGPSMVARAGRLFFAESRHTMFGNKALPSVIYKYGARRPVTNADEVDRQVRDAHRYRNKLVEIERDRRSCVNAKLMQLAPRLLSLETEIERLDNLIAEKRSEIKRANATRRRRDVTPEQRAELRQWQADRKALRTELKERKADAFADPRIRTALAKVDAEALAASKAARAASGVYWGTYCQVEQSLSGMRSGAPPRFLRFDGTGKLAVQLQGGLSVAKAFAGEDRRLIIEPVPPKAYLPGEPKALQRTRVWLRIGSDGREPIWTIVPITLHRPLPDDASIKWVYLTRRRVATKDRWSVCFVLARESGWQKPELARNGSVGVNLGWRVMDNGVERGLRVARWVGDDGTEGELRLPMPDVERWKKTEDLQAIRDQRFNAAVSLLADWLADPGCLLPDWLVERTATLRQWRSAARLAAIAIQWRGERFEGDDTAFATLEAWRKKDKHLYEWQANQLRKAIAWREDLYRNLAATLSRRYHTVCLANTDWRDLARRPTAEQAETDAGARRYQRVASPGALGRLLRERFAETVTVDSRHITQRCHACGEVNQFDAAAHVRATCRHCGAEWDQDINAARNILRAASGPVACETP